MPSVEWTTVATGVGVGASAASLLAALWATKRGVVSLWQRSIGRRRAHARLLDQLCCGSSLEYLETYLGVPQFRSESIRVYRLSGSWVSVHEQKGAVQSFSITITDERLYYSPKRITMSNIDTKLGRDRFDSLSGPVCGQFAWVGARRAGYVEEYYFGNPGGYQHYWLSYNDAGSGSMKWLAQGMFELRSGSFGSTKEEVAASEVDAPPARANGLDVTTINTVSVLGPNVDPAPLREGGRFGVDLDQVRMTWQPKRSQLALSQYWRLILWRLRRRIVVLTCRRLK